MKFKSSAIFKKIITHKWRSLAVLLCACFLFSSTYLLALNLTGNFHTVLPGEMYRSAQLEAGDIPRLQARYHIKSILNLRGDNTGKKWYDDEIKASQDAKIVHLNFRMSSARQLKKEEVITLIDVMRNAPKPLLIHCMAGQTVQGLHPLSMLLPYLKGVRKLQNINYGLCTAIYFYGLIVHLL